MKLLPARTQAIPKTPGSWQVTVAQYQYTMNYDYYYAGILQWEILHTPEGKEYTAFSWGITISNDKEI